MFLQMLRVSDEDEDEGGTVRADVSEAAEAPSCTSVPFEDSRRLSDEDVGLIFTVNSPDTGLQVT